MNRAEFNSSRKQWKAPNICAPQLYDQIEFRKVGGDTKEDEKKKL